MSIAVPLDSTPSVYPRALDDPQTMLSAFGQSSVRASPLQMAMVSAAIANGGALMAPNLVESVVASDLSVIEAFEPARHFRYRYWSTNHGTEDRPENRMVVDYRLQAEGEGCRLSVTHENLLSSERAAMMDGVWDYLLGQLRAHVEGASVG